MRDFILLSAWILALATTPLAARRVRAFVFDEPKTVDNVSIGFDINRSDVPLAFIGQILRDTGIPGGVAELEGCSGVPAVHFTANQGMTIRGVLDGFVVNNPDYKWQLDGDVINLEPRTGVPLLDARIRDFQVDTTDKQMTAEAILYDLLKLPGVRQRAAELKLKSGVMTGGPGVYTENPQPRAPVPIRITLKDISLREAFDSVVRTYRHTIWIYVQTECNGEKTYVIGTETD